MNDVAIRLDELIPDPVGVTARMAYLQLLRFQELSASVAVAHDLAAKQQLGKIAAWALEAHERLMALLAERGQEGRKRFVGVARESDDFARRVAGRDPDERLVTLYIAGGVLADFYAEVVAALPEQERERLAPWADLSGSERALAEILRSAMERDQRLGDRLAMWGRRIASDCVLACRRALGIPEGSTAEEARPGSEEAVEQLTGRLMADHSRRMNALGFAA